MDPKEYELEYFRTNKFYRKQCPICKRYFRTQDENTEICGEPPCGEYKFIGNSPMNKSMNLHEMREFYLKFFEENGHKRINRYPITARWRDDVFFTQASIYDFQPHVLNETVEPPANPLTISQTCVRFNDIDNVGKTGRHFTMFEMLAHHVFNKTAKFIYFKDRTVELCNTLLTERLGIKPKHITYVEAEWEGGGNAGPCFEVIVDGIELATLVFMMYKDVSDNNGNVKRELMDMQVVDTGYGLERFVWMSQGKENAYECIFPDVLKFLKDKAGIKSDDYQSKILAEYSRVAGNFNVESNRDLNILREEAAKRIGISVDELNNVVFPYENLYAVADHTRALMFLLNDGVVPSNTKAGYFARLLVRRTIRALKNLNLGIPLAEIVEKQIDTFKNEFPDVNENRVEILNLVDIEEKKYVETLKEGKNIVSRLVKQVEKEKRNIETDDLILLYDTYGLNPEIVKEFLGDNEKSEISIPDDFYIRVAKAHEKENKGNVEKENSDSNLNSEGIPDTELLYYEDSEIFEFDAKILKILNLDKGKTYIILDKTYFYPEGGGQECDMGFIGNLRVSEVQKKGKIVGHEVEGNIENLKENQVVHCKVDKERRGQLTTHHTATHIINACARNLLGNHIYQSGAHKSVDMARLDITHYALLTDDELQKLEQDANEIVTSANNIEISFMERNNAESKYGFRLYQGGAVPGKFIRVIKISDDKGNLVDAEACGGTHFNNTGDVGIIKLTGQKRIQDGVLRLEFVAGKKAMEYITNNEKILKKSSATFSVEISKLPKTCERFFDEWKGLRKENKELKNIVCEILKENLKGKEAVRLQTDYLDANEITDIAKNLRNFVIVNFKNKILVSDLDLINLSVKDLKIIRDVKGEKGNFKVYVFGNEGAEGVKTLIKQ
ncbi:MAG: alanine--tRNA ligase [Candidatus Altiarchaeales archaeon A3]|nr:MAG: alanine--tRNA ligase [Candidatus Altiarchaeales archaeon A3]